MRKLLLTILLVSGICFGTMRIRPSLTVGKMTNGDFYYQIIPFKFAYEPLPEWMFGSGFSLGFQRNRSAGIIGMPDHRGWAFRGTVQYKPLNFLSNILGKSTLSDFYIRYQKQVGGWYTQSPLNIGRLNYDNWEELSIGFDITI